MMNRSTKAALFEGRRVWRHQAGPVDEHFYDRKGAFDLIGCSAGEENCACTNANAKIEEASEQ